METNDDTRYFLNLASRQQVDVWLTFYLDQCIYSRLKTTCVGIKNGHFIVRANLHDIDKNPIVWGTEADAYFSVRDIETTYCHFIGKLSRMYNSPGNDMYLIFPLPRHLDHNQRRCSRRVAMDFETISNFSLWYGAMEGLGMEDLPRLIWKTLKGQPCELADISANGLRLDIADKSPLGASLYNNVPILLRGNFGLPRKAQWLYIISHVVRKTPNFEREDTISIGCHFSRWCKIEENKDHVWFKADSDGIGLVAQWITRNFRMTRN